MNPTGWNPCEKVYPKSLKKKNIFTGVLNRHKAFLKNLEIQKNLEKEGEQRMIQMEEDKIQNFKLNAEKQRKKIKLMKESQALMDEEEDQGPVNEMEFEEVVNEEK